MNAISADTFCSTYSRGQADPLMGTATRADVWLLLEYREAFGRKAVEEAALPASVRDHLDRAVSEIPNTRLQLIQQLEVGDSDEGILFAVAVSDEVDPWLTVFHLPEVDEIVQIDIKAVVQGDSRYAAQQGKELMVLVCGNANRDPCCGFRAQAAVQKLQKKLGHRLFMSSHVGGHRYAATGVVLPRGIMFGRLDDADSDAFVEDIEAGRIHLPTLRGQSIYDPPAQAADSYLRQNTGLLAFDAFRLTTIEAVGIDSWKVTFTETGSGATHRLQIGREDSDFVVITSCGADRGEPTDLYHLISYEQNEGSRAS